ncbi:MAG TPA: hypothetical protein VK900_06730 [Anaerolineales bacterium]|nr:hypothetical protein [Anaerolineales bacterium]
MASNRRFSSALQALTELQSERAETPGSGELAPAVPALRDVLAKIGSIPAEALFLGMASDGLPVLLNLHDPHPGPMLVTGDPGSGKTIFLQTITHALTQTHDARLLQYGVITNYPDEWTSLTATPHRNGIFVVGNNDASEYINSLAAWAHSNKNSKQCILMLVDDMESVALLDPPSVHNFRWLLLRGPARRVWPIVTLSAPRYGQVLAWLQNYRTRIFGRVANPRVAQALGAEKVSLEQLEAGIQFSLPEREKWLRFWLPSC